MSTNSLQLEKREDPLFSTEELTVGDTVRIYSGKIDNELTMEISHLDEDEIGGIVSADVPGPFVEKGDHIHFQPENILDRVND